MTHSFGNFKRKKDEVCKPKSTKHNFGVQICHKKVIWKWVENGIPVHPEKLLVMVSGRFCHCNQLPCVFATGQISAGSQAPLYGRQLVMTHIANWNAMEIGYRNSGFPHRMVDLSIFM